MVLCETPGIIQINSIFLYMQITFWGISYVYLFCRIGFIYRSIFTELSLKDFRWGEKKGKMDWRGEIQEQLSQLQPQERFWDKLLTVNLSDAEDDEVIKKNPKTPTLWVCEE